MSWDEIEQFYRETVKIPQSSKILEMIAQMRERGHDRTFRAGQSMYAFVVSRSRRHGLSTDQPRIVFYVHENGMDVAYYDNTGSEKKTSYAKIEYTSQIGILLKQFEVRDIF